MPYFEYEDEPRTNELVRGECEDDYKEREMPYTVLQLTTHFQDGDTMHRMTWPIQALAALPEFRVIDMHYMCPYSYRLALEADLLILSMIRDAELAPIVRWRKAKGKATVFEVNNSPFDIHPLTPMFELWSNPANQADFLYTLKIVDLVQTSSPPLAEAFKPFCERVAVFPNQIAKAWRLGATKPEKPLIVAWAGSLSHVGDVAHAAKAVCQWVREHEGVEFRIMGHAPMEKLFDLPPEKKKFVLWGGMEAYEEFLKGVHIGLAPLGDTAFNRARSDVKWLECAAQGVVFVGQRLPTFAEVEDGKTGFLFKDTAEMLGVLDKLYKNRKLMQSVSRAAFEHVTQKRRYDIAAQERAKVYKELMDRKPPADSEKWVLDKTSTFPKIQLPDPLPGYLPVSLAEEDQRALAEVYSRRSDVSEAAIQRVEQRYGEFHITCYARASAAMARRDVAAAERYLRQSLSHYPAALASLQFLAQLLVGTRRVEEGAGLLKFAAQWHEACVPIYRQQLAIAEMQSDWTTGIAVTEAWEKNCDQDPSAPLRRGLLLIRAGRTEEGMAALLNAMNRFKERVTGWYPPFAAEVPAVLRQAEPLMTKEPKWPDLILKAAEMFPHGLWLPTRAGQICCERGEYERGARLLQAARERLLELEWQRAEGINVSPDYRRMIEFYRMACEGLTKT